MKLQKGGNIVLFGSITTHTFVGIKEVNWNLSSILQVKDTSVIFKDFFPILTYCSYYITEKSTQGAGYNWSLSYPTLTLNLSSGNGFRFASASNAKHISIYGIG